VDRRLDVQSLGLALEIEPVIAAVQPGSPAEQAGLKPGDRISTFQATIPALGSRDENRQTYELDETIGWPFLFDLMQELPLKNIALGLEGRDEPVALSPEPVADWYDPRRGLGLQGMSRPMPPMSLADAVQEATSETLQAIGSIYVLIRGLSQQRVGREAVAGPIRIAGAAYQIAGQSTVEFLWFIGFISINLTAARWSS